MTAAGLTHEPADAAPTRTQPLVERGSQRPARHPGEPAGLGVTPPENERVITLVADKATHAYLVRAYRDGKLIGYTIRDAYGWAIIAKRRGRIRTVDRFDTPDGMSEPEGGLRDYAVNGLFRLAATGSTGDGFWDLPYQRGAR